jgi:hypothetical protein
MNQECHSYLKAQAHFFGNRFAHPLRFNFYHFAFRHFAYHHLLSHYHLLEYMEHFKHLPLMHPFPHFGCRYHSLDGMSHFGHNHSLNCMNRFNQIPLMHPLPPFGRRCHSLGPENRHTSNLKLFSMHRSHSLDSLHYNPCSRRSRSLEMMNQFGFPNIHHCGHRVRSCRSLSPKPVSNNFIYDHPHYKCHNH